MSVERLIELAKEWREAQVTRMVSEVGSLKNREAQQTIEHIYRILRTYGLDITTDDWANVVIQMPFKL